MEDGKAIGWIPAALRATGILVVGVLMLVVVPNVLVTKLTGISRDWRVAVATTWFAVMLVGASWILRRLQARDVV